MCCPGGVAAEDPVAIRVRRRLAVPGVAQEFAPGRAEPIGECDREATERDDDQLVGDSDVVPRQRDNVLELLAEGQDQDGRCAVSRCERVAVDDLREGSVLGSRAELLAGAAAMARDGQAAAGESVVDGPVEEPVCDQSGCRPAGDPGVEVGLLQVLERGWRSWSQLRKLMATVTVCLLRRNVPCGTVSIWFIRRRRCQRT